MQDTGFALLILGSIAFQIDATMLGTGIGNAKSKNAGLLVGAYTMGGSASVILMDELGGYLFQF